MKGPSNVLSVKNVSDYHLTCKTICGYIVEKDPSGVLSVINVSPGNRHCFITKENTILIHRTNVNHAVNLSLMTMLWRGTIARNDLLETRKDSPAGCVMNTAMIIVDIFITCINTCNDNNEVTKGQKINNSTLPGNEWGALENGLWAVVQTLRVRELLFGFSSSVQFCTHLWPNNSWFGCSLVSVSIEHAFLRPWFSQHRYAVYNG